MHEQHIHNKFWFYTKGKIEVINKNLERRLLIMILQKRKSILKIKNQKGIYKNTFT